MAGQSTEFLVFSAWHQDFSPKHCHRSGPRWFRFKWLQIIISVRGCLNHLLVEHPNLILKLVAEAVLRTCILVIINLG